ncbi:MAG TPA: DUF3189 family protein [Paenibacillus sp.]
MIYIYNCYGGTHSSALAAAYHLRKLPSDRVPSKDEILKTDSFNKLTTKEMGKLIYHGSDRDGNKVYTVGRGSSKALIPAMKGVFHLFEDNKKLEETIIFSNTSPTVPLSMTFGGLFSRRLKLDFIGVPLLVMGAKKSSPKIIQLVEETKQRGKTSTTQIISLDNVYI